MKLLALLLYAPLVWASDIDYARPPAPDFPDLRIIEHFDSPAATAEWCQKRGAAAAVACAGPNFTEGVCDIHFPHNPPRWMVVHEYAHCRGYDHHWDAIVHDSWARYKRDVLEWRYSE